MVKKRTVGKICSSLGRYIGREAVIEHDYEKKVCEKGVRKRKKSEKKDEISLYGNSSIAEKA